MGVYSSAEKQSVYSTAPAYWATRTRNSIQYYYFVCKQLNDFKNFNLKQMIFT